MAWTGQYFSGTGAIFTVGIAAAWAIGRRLHERAVPLVAFAFLVGAVLNAGVAMAQGVVDLSSADLPLLDDRSTGLLSNPVFLGATCAAAVALVPLVLRRSVPGGLVVALLLAAGVQMSGARNSLVVTVLLAAWMATRLGRRTGAALVVAIALGLTTGVLLQGHAGTTATARLASPGGGLSSRLANWKAGTEAAVAHPFTGYGPGRWRAATSPRRTLALARSGPDRLYVDAHNLVVEYLGTTGFVGAALLLAWLAAIVTALRRGAQPELVAAAAVLLLAHALEPQHVTVTPLMLLLAGAAAARNDAAETGGRATLVTQTLLVVTALVLAGRVVTGDVLLRSGARDFAMGPTARASALLWPWPDGHVIESRIHAFRARTEKDPRELAKALDDARRARRLEPDNPTRSIAVAAYLGQLGSHDRAAREYAHALELDPWSRQALARRGDELVVLALPAEARSCRIASQLDAHTDGVLRTARRACLTPVPRSPVAH
jgi:hypothetical protein